jgi:hypothetical protein
MPRTTKPKGKSKKAPATAAGQALGYSLQYTRLTAMLLEARDESSCSLEVLDDVAEQKPGGKTRLAQSKSALTDNPVADRAIPLWKTIFNWLELVKGGFVVPSATIFEIYVSRPVRGKLIDCFHNCGSHADAKAAMNIARKLLWGESPRSAQRAALPVNLSRYVNAVLEADDKLLLPIIANLRLKCGSGSPQADIEAAIRKGPVSEGIVFDIADKLCGWVKRQVDKQLEKGLPAVILREEFHREYRSYVRRVDRDIILKGFAGKPSDADKLERLPDTFVRQLDLIERSFDEKLEAISDFLQACYDRAMWSKSGDVHEESFADLDERLGRAWQNLNVIVNVDAGAKPEVQRGQLLYAKCMMHTTPVQGMETPPYFIPGCFQRLADDLVIGWHPNYRGLVKSAGERS